MLPLLPAHLKRTARRWLLLCLIAAVPVYGLSGSLVDLLGSRHVHRDPALAAAAFESAMAGWQDFRRGVPGAAAARERLPHTHSAFERHHHDAGDASVVALDGHSHDGGPADDGAASAGAAPHLLASSALATLAVAEPATGTWPARATPPVGGWMPERLERPPRA